jgi:hypothetical protein
MVQALIAGRKTQTRRTLRLPDAPSALGTWEASTIGGAGVSDSKGRPVAERPCVWHTRTAAVVAPRFCVGDRLYVRESWRVSPEAAEGWHPDDLRGWIDYQAGGSAQLVAPSFEAVEKAAFTKNDDRDWDFLPSRYRPGIHMPRWASRLTLAVTDVRVERLQECSEADAIAEGIIEFEPTEEDPAEFAYVDGGDIWNNARSAYAALWNSINGPGAWEANPWVVAISFTVEQRNIDT